MKTKVGQTTDNGSKLGLRRGSLGPMPLVPDARTPSVSLVAIVASLVLILLLGASVVVYRELSALAKAPETIPLAGPPGGDCWQDGALAGACPDLEGEEALTWLYQSDPAFTECAKSQGTSGELFTVRCEYSDLNVAAGGDPKLSTYVFLSVWKDSQAMVTYYKNTFGTDYTLVDIGSVPKAGVRWSDLAPRGAGPSTAIGYAHYPYSVLVMGPEANRDIAESRIRLRPPSELAAQV